ncbi:MAG: RNA helicase [Candidatus Aenigmarchaeota archaeon ex4484_52]|nr:MAG: RNA helicase [Candidatus Aenigmarchaeota archaeon ex4484_52]
MYVFKSLYANKIFMHLEHPYLKKDLIEKRYYQESIINSSKNKNSLIVLPTGIGKTIIAIGIIAYQLEKNLFKKILFLSPTKPLAKQHEDSLKNLLNFEKEKIMLLTGQIAPKSRKAIYKQSQIIVATPQVIENDILTNSINLDEFCLIVFDEAHRTIGDYAYNFIAKKYFSNNQDNKIITALTASPGYDRDKITEICNNLFIEHIEIRKEDDADIKQYTHQIKKNWIFVELNYQYKTALNLLEKTANKPIKALNEAKIIFGSKPSKKQLLFVQNEMMSKIRNNKNPSYFNYISMISQLIKLNYLIELLSTQGANQAKQYCDKLKLEQSKASKNLFNNNDFKLGLIHIDKLAQNNEFHPKIQKIKEILINEIEGQKKAIIFTQYINSVEQILNSLKSLDDKIKPVKFIGQHIGNTQKQQIEILDKFRADKYNVLVSTSVGEEGLDIPKVDIVVFYEPIPSEIRTIQRRGRTGRQKTGSIHILIAKNTIDEGYFWASKAKEKKMHKTLQELKNAFENPGVVLKQKKPTLADFAPANEKITIIADVRESKINKKLSELANKNNIELKINQLKVADFVLSDRLGVERKQIDDFIDSIIDKRLFEQMTSLSSSFLRPILIIEDVDAANIFDLKYSRNINIDAVIGAINSISIDFRIPIYFTKDIHQTCDILICLAKREQTEKNRSVQIGSARKVQSFEEIQEQIIGSFPRINRNIAIKLLDEFKSIKNIVNANLDKLIETESIGTLRAKKIKEVCEWERK